MKVDVYRRLETEGKYSYLAVPEGRPIPNEATNIEWETAWNGLDIDEANDPIDELPADSALHQISTKGYAITSIRSMGLRA